MRDVRNHVRKEERARPTLKLHTKDEGDFVFWWLDMDGFMTERYTAADEEAAELAAKFELLSRGVDPEVIAGLEVRHG